MRRRFTRIVTSRWCCARLRMKSRRIRIWWSTSTTCAKSTTSPRRLASQPPDARREHRMSLLKRLEHDGVAQAPPVAQAHPPTISPPMVQQATEAQRGLKDRVKRKLISELDPSLDTAMVDEVRYRLKSLFDQIIESENLVLTRVEKERLFEDLAADVVGFGPIAPLLDDPSVSEVMVNGPKKVYFERKGR